MKTSATGYENKRVASFPLVDATRTFISIPKSGVVRTCSSRSEVLDHLVAQYAPASVLCFGSEEMVKLCEEVFDSLGNPDVMATNGWTVFTAMIEKML